MQRRSCTQEVHAHLIASAVVAVKGAAQMDRLKEILQNHIDHQDLSIHLHQKDRLSKAPVYRHCVTR